MSLFVNTSALLTLALMALLHSGSAEEKLFTCCTTVSRDRIQEPIIGVLYQKKNNECVNAYIFQTENGLYCISHQAWWVRNALQKLIKEKAKATIPSPTQRTTSLLSILASSAQPSGSSLSPSSSSLSPSSSSLSPSSTVAEKP